MVLPIKVAIRDISHPEKHPISVRMLLLGILTSVPVDVVVVLTQVHNVVFSHLS